MDNGFMVSVSRVITIPPWRRNKALPTELLDYSLSFVDLHEHEASSATE
jgi:hypothetical protein